MRKIITLLIMALLMAGTADVDAKVNKRQTNKKRQTTTATTKTRKKARPAAQQILPPPLSMTQEGLKDIAYLCREWAKTKTTLSEKLLSRFNDGVEIYKQALKGDPECQHWMGDYYDYKRCKSEALSWYYLAAKQGYAPAEELVGDSYREGKNGIERHSFEAAKWYARAEAHEEGRTVFVLGQMLVHGEITKEEFRIANELAHNDVKKVMKRAIDLANEFGGQNNAAANKKNKKNENDKKYARFYGTWTSARGSTFTISEGPYLDLRGAGKFSGEWRSNGELHVSFGYPDEINLKYSNGYLYDRDGRMYWRVGQ